MSSTRKSIFNENFHDDLSQIQDKLVPEAMQVLKRLEGSKKMYDALDKASNSNLEIAVCDSLEGENNISLLKGRINPIAVCDSLKGENNREWIVLFMVISQEIIQTTVYTMADINDGKVLLRFLPNSPDIKWEVIYPDFFQDYRELFYHKFYDNSLDDKKLIEEYLVCNPHEIIGEYSVENQMYLEICKEPLIMVAFDKGDTLEICLQNDGVKLGFARNDLIHYNHFVPYSKIAEKESLREFYEIATVFTSKSRYLVVAEDNLHYFDKLMKVCTLNCYLELMGCLM